MFDETEALVPRLHGAALLRRPIGTARRWRCAASTGGGRRWSRKGGTCAVRKRLLVECAPKIGFSWFITTITRVFWGLYL